jgi:SET domain-containing protein
MNPYDLELLTYLAPSKVCNGVGVFALVNTPKGTIIFKPSKSIKVSWCSISEDIHERVKSITVNDNEGFWIDCDLNKMYGAYYINHTDENENVRYNYENGSWYATRDILKGEELINTYEEGEKDWLT